MPDPDREAWLKSLKKGDKVAVRYSIWSDDYTIIRVDKITPKGKIRCSDGELYNSNGVRTDLLYDYKIKPFTQEVKDQLRRRELIRDISVLFNGKEQYAEKPKAITLKQLEEIWKIINKEEEK